MVTRLAYYDKGVRLVYSYSGFWVNKTVYDGSFHKVVSIKKISRKPGDEIYIKDITIDYRTTLKEKGHDPHIVIVEK